MSVHTLGVTLYEAELARTCVAPSTSCPRSPPAGTARAHGPPSLP